MNVWDDDDDGRKSFCNMINGSDATAYPPFQKGQKGDSVFIFSTDICRLLFICLVIFE